MQEGLAAVEGMMDTLAEQVHDGGNHFSEYVGMQLMAERGLENGETLASAGLPAKWCPSPRLIQP